MSVSTVKATINGSQYDLLYNELTQKWETTITAPSKSSYNQTDHYYNVTIVATDDSGNDTTVSGTSGNFQDELRLVVKEKVAPVITITSPTSGAHIITNKPNIQFSITDNDSGVNPDTISIRIDTGETITTEINKTPSGKNYNCSYIPEIALGDGIHTVYINAKDYDENSAEEKSVQFTVDTVAPTLNITSPEEGLKTNTNVITVSGTTNDETSSPVTVTIKLNNGSEEPVEVQGDGSFTKELTIQEGENTIVITATDSAGKSASVTRIVTLDTGVPEFISVSISPNPVDAGQTYVISVEVIDE